MALREQVLKSMGERMRKAREKAKLSQRRVAYVLDVPEGTIRRWETGRSEPRHESVEAYAKAVGVKAEWLWYGDSATPG